MFAVAVTFRLRPGARAAFEPLMIKQAENSLALEPGCRHFDVWADQAQPETIFLYEIYDDAAAFDAHLASEHFKNFDADAAPLVEERVIARFDHALSICKSGISA